VRRSAPRRHPTLPDGLGKVHRMRVATHREMRPMNTSNAEMYRRKARNSSDLEELADNVKRAVDQLSSAIKNLETRVRRLEARTR
jgi:ubiquinone biosynthesis protein UbiJ